MKKILFEIFLIIMLTVFLYHSVKYNMQTPEQTEIAHIKEVKTTSFLPSIIDDKGQYVFDGTDSAFFIDDFVYDPKYKAIPAYVFADAAMRERKYGLIRADGNCLLAPVFDHVEVPVDDYVKVAINDDEEKLYGVIQILGQPSGYFEDKVVPVDDMETNKNITENINEEGKNIQTLLP